MDFEKYFLKHKYHGTCYYRDIGLYRLNLWVGPDCSTPESPGLPLNSYTNFAVDIMYDEVCMSAQTVLSLKIDFHGYPIYNRSFLGVSKDKVEEAFNTLYDISGISNPTGKNGGYCYKCGTFDAYASPTDIVGQFICYKCCWVME